MFEGLDEQRWGKVSGIYYLMLFFNLLKKGDRDLPRVAGSLESLSKKSTIAGLGLRGL
jgi:hypothetical protein